MVCSNDEILLSIKYVTILAFFAFSIFRDKSSTSNMKIDTLAFLGCILAQHPPKVFHPHIHVLVPVSICMKCFIRHYRYPFSIKCKPTRRHTLSKFNVLMFKAVRPLFLKLSEKSLAFKGVFKECMVENCQS